MARKPEKKNFDNECAPVSGSESDKISMYVRSPLVISLYVRLVVDNVTVGLCCFIEKKSASTSILIECAVFERRC